MAVRNALVLAVIAACTALLIGCRDEGDSSEANNPSPTPAATLPPESSATRAAEATGCGEGQQPPEGDSDGAMRFGGLQRTYLLHVPPSYDGVTPMPLVFTLHGYSSSGREQASYSRFPAKADAEGFVVVSPDGGGSPPQWNLFSQNNLPDDIGFVSALLDKLQRELCIDADRVFVAGMSNGAAFAQRLACEMPERFVAVAAVTAMLYPALCASDQPIPIIGFHGTDDACVPFNGGPVACGSRRGEVPPVEESAENWARHNGCNLDPERARLSADVRTIAYSECDGEVAVVLFIIEGGGHAWPGSVRVPRLGATTDQIDATEQIWQFFEGQANLRTGSAR